GCDPADPLGVLAAVGGLEHAALAGFILGGAARRIPVVLDGGIACAAALAARAVAAGGTGFLLAGHLSTAARARRGLRPPGRPPRARRAGAPAAARPWAAPRRGVGCGAGAARGGRRGPGAARHGHVRQRRGLRREVMTRRGRDRGPSPLARPGPVPLPGRP